MPAKTEKQRRLFGAALGFMRGEKGVSPAAKEIAKKVPPEKIKDFARKVK